jgi:hypothetical protein
MPNPFDPSYLTQSSAAFGPFAWIFFLLQFLLVGAGFYYKAMRSDSNALRKQLLEQLGLALMIAGGIGIVLGGLRLGNVAVFAQRFWFYLVLVGELALGAYAAYYARNEYPRRLRVSQTQRGKSSAKRQNAQVSSAPSSRNGNADAEMQETTAGDQSRTRREARRERKRRKK